MTDLSSFRPGLLVSVRSADEAELALRGGANLIDVKDPSRGSLGRPDDATIAKVVQRVAGRTPVSAAMSDLTREPPECRVPGVSFAKWGLAGWQNRGDELHPVLESLLPLGDPPRRNVLVAYADWERAESPPPDDLATLARKRRMPAFVIDTYIKDGSTLLDWMSVSQLVTITCRCQADGIPVALAGSLGLAEIAPLRGVRPSWFAVRGAACSGGRNGTIDEDRVRELKELISSFDYANCPAIST